MADQNTQPTAPQGDRFTKEVYTDGFSQVHLVNGAIKIDLLTINPNGTDKPEAVVGSRLVMSLNQFLLSMDVLTQMIDQLVAKGVIKKDK